MMNFPYSSNINAVFFGNEKKLFYIHDVFINENFFATSPDFPDAFERKKLDVQMSSGSFLHINSDTGEILIHFMCTGEYKLPDEAKAFDTTAKLERFFTNNILNLFAAEMCNIYKLHDLIRLKIEKLSLSLNIFRSLQLVDSVLNSQDIRERKDETAKSREWLIEHSKKRLLDVLEESDKIFNEFKLSDFTHKSLFLEDMGTEIIRFMFDQMANIRTELSEVKKSEKNTKRRLEESMAEKEEIAEKNRIMEKQLKTENKGRTSCDSSNEIDGESNAVVL